MFEENYGNDSIRALNRVSYAELIARECLSPRGLLMVALPDEVNTFASDVGTMGMEEIPVSEAARRVPILSPEIARAAIHEGAQDIDTDKLLQSYVKEARGHGAVFEVGQRVNGISRIGEKWRVQSVEKNWTADAIINAAGAWADQIATMSGVAPMSLTPFRRSMARIAAPGALDVRRWPMLFGPGESWYAKPDAGAWLISPAEEDASEPMDAWADDMILAEGLDRYQRHVTEPVTRITASWAGLRTFAPDRTPVVGQGKSTRGFFWLAGQGGYGFQTAPAIAGLIADLVLENPPTVDAATVHALSPDRFLT